jgi:EAL domain-containing protein (putative c-di-GMP-specific phosphodiesterase class I)/GGDEF domain-containing protein
MRNQIAKLRTKTREKIIGPQILAFLPALSLASYWLVGEGGLIAASLGLPLIWTFVGGFSNAPDATSTRTEHFPVASAQLQQQAEALFNLANSGDRTSVFILSVDATEDFAARFDTHTENDVHDQLFTRIKSQLRATDIVTLTSPFTWAIVLTPGARLDLEVSIQQARRLQSTLDDPFVIGQNRHYFTACIGFTVHRLEPHSNPGTLIAQALTALNIAQDVGPETVRAYAGASATARLAAPVKLDDIAPEEASEIKDENLCAWFQPQISTDTGEVTGFEALARWSHPDKGTLPPGAFLNRLTKAGRLERLTEIMMNQSMSALKKWDEHGLHIDAVGVNFAHEDLSNPKLYDKIAWDLDRFDIAPRRLCIEVLESVVAGGGDDVIVRNVQKLSDLGCLIDLDDFGTGHASISTLRRLPISRLKIDRSFVAKADLDPEQQKMVATILMMAERLGLTCLAEGVETVGEHTILAQLGCRYVQGYGIAKPMPFSETIDWANTYQKKIASPLQIGKKTG